MINSYHRLRSLVERSGLTRKDSIRLLRNIGRSDLEKALKKIGEIEDLEDSFETRYLIFIRQNYQEALVPLMITYDKDKKDDYAERLEAALDYIYREDIEGALPPKNPFSEDGLWHTAPCDCFY